MTSRCPIKEKIDTIVRKVYGGDGVDYSHKADRAIEYLESIGLGRHARLHRQDAVLALR